MLPRTPVYASDAERAIFIKKKPTYSVLIDETLISKNFKHECDKLVQSDQMNIETTMKQRLRRKTDNSPLILAEEIKQIKRQEFVDRKRRQQLRNDCEELRILAEQLRLAAITKELDEHMKEKNRKQQLAKNLTLEGLQRAEAERQQVLANELEQELKKKEQQRQLRNTLSTQIEEIRQRRQQQYVETLAEREERVAMQQQIEEDDRREQLELKRLKQKNQEDIIQSIKEKQEYKEMQKKMFNEDMSKVYEKQLEIERHKQKLEEDKKEAIRKQQEISMRIGQQVFEIEDRKRQRDNVLLDLLQAEYKAKGDELYRQQLQREHLERQRAREELERYRSEILERNLKILRHKNEQSVEKNLMCPEDRVIQNEIQERERRKEHGAQLLSMIEENNHKRAKAIEENIQFFESKAKSESERQDLIKEERLQMLASVPASVLQYLPNQVLSESDRKYFNVPGKH